MLQDFTTNYNNELHSIDYRIYRFASIYLTFHYHKELDEGIAYAFYFIYHKDGADSTDNIEEERENETKLKETIRDYFDKKGYETSFSFYEDGGLAGGKVIKKDNIIGRMDFISAVSDIVKNL